LEPLLISKDPDHRAALQCVCDAGFSGVDCSAKQCAENCYLAGGVCTAEGTCDLVCSNRVGYECTNLTVARGESSRGRCSTPSPVSPVAPYPLNWRAW
jgi:hypothetical protein